MMSCLTSGNLYRAIKNSYKKKQWRPPSKKKKRGIKRMKFLQEKAVEATKQKEEKRKKPKPEE
jgi:hypothetical protein